MNEMDDQSIAFLMVPMAFGALVLVLVWVVLPGKTGNKVSEVDDDHDDEEFKKEVRAFMKEQKKHVLKVLGRSPGSFG